MVLFRFLFWFDLGFERGFVLYPCGVLFGYYVGLYFVRFDLGSNVVLFGCYLCSIGALLGLSLGFHSGFICRLVGFYWCLFLVRFEVYLGFNVGFYLGLIWV